MQPVAIAPTQCHGSEQLLLVQEISHRVMNEYSHAIAGIRLAARAVASDEARAALATAATTLMSYAEAHRALQAPTSKGSADLSDYLGRLCSTMTASRLQERGVRLTLSADSVMLPAERCWRIALIVSELITNSLRHGLKNGPGHIRVELEAGNPTTVCRIVDNGSGPTALKPGCGFKVVAGLASEIGGTVRWSFGPEGANAELIFQNHVTPEHLP